MATIPKEKLTPEYLKAYAEEQITLYLDPEHTNEPLAEQHLAKAYEVVGLKAPKEYIWYDSPMAFSEVRASVWASVRASVRASVWASVGDSVWDSVWASVWASVGDSVWASVGDSVWASVGTSVWASVWAWYDAPYNAQSKFFNDNLEKNNLEHMCLFDELVNGYYLEAERAHIIRKPIRLVRSAAGRLHYDHDKAIEWADGTGFYYLHGVEFTKEQWERITSQEVTLTEFAKMNLDNDQRPAALQMLRPDRLLEQVKAKLVDTGKRGVRLYEVPNFMDTGDTEYVMRMEHPTIKGKEYLEWIRPEVGKLHDADEGMVSNRGITKAQYLKALIA